MYCVVHFPVFVTVTKRIGREVRRPSSKGPNLLFSGLDQGRVKAN